MTGGTVWLYYDITATAVSDKVTSTVFINTVLIRWIELNRLQDNFMTLFRSNYGVLVGKLSRTLWLFLHFSITAKKLAQAHCEIPILWLLTHSLALVSERHSVTTHSKNRGLFWLHGGQNLKYVILGWQWSNLVRIVPLYIILPSFMQNKA